MTQKSDLNSFIPSTIPRELLGGDQQRILISLSEYAFDAIHCFTIHQIHLFHAELKLSKRCYFLENILVKQAFHQNHCR